MKMLLVHFVMTQMKHSIICFGGVIKSLPFILMLNKYCLAVSLFYQKLTYFFAYKFIRKHPFNFLIYHLKYYIFCKKLDLKDPSLNDFLNKFKYALSVEEFISKTSKPLFTNNELRLAFHNCDWLFD